MVLHYSSIQPPKNLWEEGTTAADLDVEWIKGKELDLLPRPHPWNVHVV